MQEILNAIAAILRDYNAEGYGRMRYRVYEGMDMGHYILQGVVYFDGKEVDRVKGMVVMGTVNEESMNYCRVLVFTQSLYHILSWGYEPEEA